MKLLIAFCVSISIFLLNTSPVVANTCRDIQNRQVCILQIKRSAKYYWQYRVSLRIEGRKQPIRFYNCRDRYYSEPDRIKVYFDENDALGKSVCRLYEKL